MNKLSAVALGCALALSSLLPAGAETVQDHKEKAAGFLAQSLCSARVNNWPLSHQRYKNELYRQAKPESAVYLSDPQVMNAASVLSLAMNSNCTDFNYNSADFKRGMKLLANL